MRVRMVSEVEGEELLTCGARKLTIEVIERPTLGDDMFMCPIGLLANPVHANAVVFLGAREIRQHIPPRLPDRKVLEDLKPDAGLLSCLDNALDALNDDGQGVAFVWVPSARGRMRGCGPPGTIGVPLAHEANLDLKLGISGPFGDLLEDMLHRDLRHIAGEQPGRVGAIRDPAEVDAELDGTVLTKLFDELHEPAERDPVLLVIELDTDKERLALHQLLHVLLQRRTAWDEEEHLAASPEARGGSAHAVRREERTLRCSQEVTG
ncbi:hypothetical protein EJ06DRAFT_144450 [Trichodelitschia bisporula]|uniref:Uncharacterized protein n=1 Tax=Trichodelitschia bisporula TaxID=703511 RepID=A0A6G1HMN6_9PEZI|nr:hypothetical protein EJ06DRAFT_144450 [Trichodelitschia bisporula]